MESLEQWQNMLAKAAKGGRLVVLQLFQVSVEPGSKRRTGA